MQKISFNNTEISFEVNKFKKYCLINGLDDIGMTLTVEDKIDGYENKASKLTPWLFENKN